MTSAGSPAATSHDLPGSIASAHFHGRDVVTVFSMRAPSTDDLASLVREQSSGGVLTYAEVGATSGFLPHGYRHDRWQIDLGPDDDDRFAQAASALRDWRPQKGAGLRIFPDEPVRPDATFALVIRVGLGFVTAAGRIVYVVDEPDRYGFAYGTLRPHPERGEESFTVVRDQNRIRFEIVSFSRPRHALARIGAPVARSLQVRITRAYLQAMRND
jgi:uncharacterized protein (UPF0548 family)